MSSYKESRVIRRHSSNSSTDLNRERGEDDLLDFDFEVVKHEMESDHEDGANSDKESTNTNPEVVNKVDSPGGTKKNKKIVSPRQNDPNSPKMQKNTEKIQNSGGEDSTSTSTPRGRGRPRKDSTISTSSSAKIERNKEKNVKTSPKPRTRRLSSSIFMSSVMAVATSPVKRDRRIPKRYLSDTEDDDGQKKKKTKDRHNSTSPARRNNSATTVTTSPRSRTLERSSSSTEKRGRGRPPKNIQNSSMTPTSSTSTPKIPKQEDALKVYDFESSSGEEEDEEFTPAGGGGSKINKKRGRGRPPKKTEIGHSRIFKRVEKINSSSPRPTPATPTPVDSGDDDEDEISDTAGKRGRGRPKKNDNQSNKGRGIGLNKRKLSPSGDPPVAKKMKLSITKINTPSAAAATMSSSNVLKTPSIKKTLEEVLPSTGKRGRGRPRKSESLPISSSKKASSSATKTITTTTTRPGSAHLPLKKRGRPKALMKTNNVESKIVNQGLLSHGLEVCVDNIQSIVNAVRGGTSRIELCSALSEGGLTPTVGLLRLGKQVAKNIPIFAMIRPRCGDFIYSEQEMKIMEMDIKSLKDAGADGFVFGILTKRGDVDVDKCARLLKLASPLPSTFHRAFDLIQCDGGDDGDDDDIDLTKKLNQSLERIVALGFQRILTSGLHSTAQQGIPLLKELVVAAKGRIGILAGAGVNPGNVEEIVKGTGVREVHGSLKMKISGGFGGSESQVSMGNKSSEDDSAHFVTSEALVTELVSNLNAAIKELDEENEEDEEEEEEKVDSVAEIEKIPNLSIPMEVEEDEDDDDQSIIIPEKDTAVANPSQGEKEQTMSVISNTKSSSEEEEEDEKGPQNQNPSTIDPPVDSNDDDERRSENNNDGSTNGGNTEADEPIKAENSASTTSSAQVPHIAGSSESTSVEFIKINEETGNLDSSAVVESVNTLSETVTSNNNNTQSNECNPVVPAPPQVLGIDEIDFSSPFT